MKLYKILPNGYFGGIVEVPDTTVGFEPGLTTTGFDFEILQGQWAYWIGSGWVLTSTDPDQIIVAPEPPPEPVAEPIPEPVSEPELQLELDLQPAEFIDPTQGI